MIKFPVLPVALMLGWLALTSGLTQGWESWTYEDWRRGEAVHAGWVAQAIGVNDALGRDQSWPGRDWRCADQLCRIHIVDFFYTGCDGVCQVLGAEFQLMQQALIQHRTASMHSASLALAASRVGLLSVSMDVRHDDAAALRRYAARHKAQPGYWSLVTPRSMPEEAALRRSLGVVAVPDGLGGYVHNASLHVVDEHGQVLGIFDHAQWRDALDLALRLARQAP